MRKTLYAEKETVPAQINVEDGRALLYQSGWIGNDRRPVETTLDVRSISILRIECGTQPKGDCDCLVRGFLYK